MPGKRVPCFPLHRGTFFHPLFLHNRSIPFNVVVQKEGDLFLPDAAAAHQGWNAGDNLAEAVNYADVAAYEYIKANLILGDKGVWPCVCGQYRVPGDPLFTPKETTVFAPKETTVKLYNPTDAGSDQLSCSAFYNWFLLLQRNLVPHIPDGNELIPGEILVRMRHYVYTRMQGEFVHA
jgi:JmjC domain, hydroxylase